jgi:hypothetical protein
MRIDVASPCKRDWSKMSGDDRVRSCADCKLNVYNLSAMTEDELAALVKEKEGRLCVRFFSRPDGTVLTRDCPVGVRRKRRTYAVSMAAMVSLLAAPFVSRGEACETGGEVTLADQVRGLVENLKVRLGLAVRPMPTHTVGMMVRVPAVTPPPAPTPPAK